jgi:hypothetical protein
MSCQYGSLYTLTKENDMDKRVKRMVEMVEVAAEGATGNEREALRAVVNWVTSGQAAKEGDSWRTMRVVTHEVGVVSTNPALREAVKVWE